MRELAEALGLHPQDVDTIAVYADALEQAGDPLGEYLNIACRLQVLDDYPPERHGLVSRMAELFLTHGERWLAVWNDPVKIFDGRRPRFCGLPSAIVLGGTLPDLAALARQVATLPIQEIELDKIGLPELAGLDGFAPLHRVTSLRVAGSYERRFGADVGAWLAARSLARVTDLSLSYVELGTSAGALLDSLPVLRQLTTFSGAVTVSQLEAMSRSPTAARVESLWLTHSDVGNGAVPLLATWPALKDVGFSRAGLDDMIARGTPPRLRWTDVDLGDNELGDRGFAWLVAALPEIKNLTLPDLTPEVAATLAPIIGQLDTLWVAAEQKTTIAALIPLLSGAVQLRSLDLARDNAGLVAGILTVPALRDVDLGTIDDDDIDAIVRSPNLDALESLTIRGVGGVGLRRLATARLPSLSHLIITSTQATEADLAVLLAAPWPLRFLWVNDAHVTDPAPVLVEHPTLELLHIERIEPRALVQMRRFWRGMLHP